MSALDGVLMFGDIYACNAYVCGIPLSLFCVVTGMKRVLRFAPSSSSLLLCQAQLPMNLPVGVKVCALEIRQHFPSSVHQRHVPSLGRVVLPVLRGDVLVNGIDSDC